MRLQVKTGYRRRVEYRVDGVRKQTLLYRVLVEEQLGRRLYPWEVVHHINGNPWDNRLDNLLCLSSQSLHVGLHHLQNKQAAGERGLFPLIVLLEITEQTLVWATPAGLATVFGREAVPLISVVAQQLTSANILTRQDGHRVSRSKQSTIQHPFAWQSP